MLTSESFCFRIECVSIQTHHCIVLSQKSHQDLVLDLIMLCLSCFCCIGQQRSHRHTPIQSRLMESRHLLRPGKVTGTYLKLQKSPKEEGRRLNSRHCSTDAELMLTLTNEECPGWFSALVYLDCRQALPSCLPEIKSSDTSSAS